MTLGDVLTCADCGARSEPLHDRGGRPFAEGGVLISTWRNGPIPRHLTASTVEPIRCAWCNDRILGFPALTARPDRGETWEVGGPLQRYHVPAWHPDQLRPRPDPYTGVGEGTLNDAAAGSPAPPQRDGNKAPLERPTAATCYYLRDGRPTDGCRPTSACWTEACGAAGIARPTALGAAAGWRCGTCGASDRTPTPTTCPLCLTPRELAPTRYAGAGPQPYPVAAPDPADELPPAAPPEPRHRAYLDDRLDGSVPEPAAAPTQLGLF